MLYLRLLGGFSLSVDGTVIQIPGTKGKALLAITATHPRRRITRVDAAALLWPHVSDRRARHSLSQLVYRLRTQLGAASLDLDASHIRLPSEIWSTDLDAIRVAGEEGDWGKVLRLYEGEFLSGLDFGDNLPLEHWREGVAATARSQVLDGCSMAAEVFESQGRWRELIELGRRWLELDITSEDAARIQVLGLRGEGRYQEASEVINQQGLNAHTDRAGVHLLKRAIGKSRNEDPVESSRIPPFTGRHSEFQQIRRELRRSFEGCGGSAFLVRGQPGVGKTRLITRIGRLATLMGARVIHAECCAADAQVPYRVILDALGDIEANEIWSFQNSRRRLWGPLVTALLAGDTQAEGAEVSHALLAKGLSKLLRFLAEGQPLLITIDDLQWVDQSSASVLQHLLTGMEDERLFILLSGRPQEVASRLDLDQVITTSVTAGRLRVLDLEALSPADAERLLTEIESVFQRPLPSTLRRQILEHAGGSPFLIVQLSHAAFEGQLEKLGHRSENLSHEEVQSDLPAAVAVFLNGRLKSLESDELKIAEICAVVGRDIAVSHLARFTRLAEEQVNRAVQGLAARGILKVGTVGVRFAHDLLQEACYRGIPHLSRTRLHCQLAEDYEESGLNAPAALHFARAGDRWNTFQSALLAGRESIRKGAPAEGEHYFRLAADNASTPKEQCAARLELGELLFAYTGYAAAEVVLAEVVRDPALRLLGPEASLRARSRLLAAEQWTGRVAPDLIQERAEDLLVECKDAGNRRLTAEILATMTFLAIRMQADGAIRQLYEDQLEQAREETGAVAVELLCGAANCAVFLGEYSSAVAVARKAVEVAPAAEGRLVGRTLGIYGLSLYLVGEFELSKAFLVSAVSTLETAACHTLRCWPMNTLGVVLMERAEVERARAVLTAVVEAAEVTTREVELAALGNLAQLEYETGNLAAVMPYYSRMIDRAGPTFPYYLEPARAIYGLANWDLGERVTAMEIAEKLTGTTDKIPHSADPGPIVILASRAKGGEEGIRILREALTAKRLRVASRWQISIELALQLRHTDRDEATLLIDQVDNEAAAVGANLYVKKAKKAALCIAALSA